MTAKKCQRWWDGGDELARYALRMMGTTEPKFDKVSEVAGNDDHPFQSTAVEVMGVG